MEEFITGYHDGRENVNEVKEVGLFCGGTFNWSK